MNLNRFCNSMILWRILIMNILIWICSKIVILIIIVCNKIIYSILSKMLCIKIRVMIACSKTIRTGRTNRIRSAFWIRTLFIILTRRLLTISKIILRVKQNIFYFFIYLYIYLQYFLFEIFEFHLYFSFRERMERRKIGKKEKGGRLAVRG